MAGSDQTTQAPHRSGTFPALHQLLLDPRNGAAWDQEPPTGPLRTYVVASTPRSGSTLLCNLIWDAGGMGAPKEYLNPMQMRDWELRLGSPWGQARNLLLWGPAVNLLSGRFFWDEPRLRAHLDRVRARRSGGGLFGLKLHLHHYQRFFGNRPPEHLLGSGLSWIHIRREDRLGQAISWVRALQTQQWASFQRPLLPAHYDRTAIARALERIGSHEKAWEQLLADRSPLRLRYEDLTIDPGGVLCAVAQHLGVTPPKHLPQAGLKRQSDGLTAEWRARFIRETGYSPAPPTGPASGTSSSSAPFSSSSGSGPSR